MQRLRATRRILSCSSKCIFGPQSNPNPAGPSICRYASGLAHWDWNGRFSGSLWDQSTGICLGKTSGIQYRYYGSLATKIQRNPSFSALNFDDVNYFKSILGEKNVIQDADKLLSANTDWLRKYKGSSQLLLLPRSTEEVSQVLKYCNSRCLAVVPQGGNTGLVGGSVPVFDEVIINMGSMNNITSFDKVSGILVCEAGCILENLVSFLDSEGFIMPLDLGAKGSCQIGGNVSTNAGGLRLVRYGSLHGSVLGFEWKNQSHLGFQSLFAAVGENLVLLPAAPGIEAVLANGDVLDMLGTLRKDNTGYDLKHLFIGSEGSLGIVTKVSILTPPKLSSVNIAFLACKDYFSCRKLLLEAKRRLGEVLSAFEFLDNESLDLVLNHLEGVRNPLPPTMHNFYVLIETTGSDESYDKEKLEAFLLRSMEGGLISDGVLAQDINQASSFWRIREGVPEALMKAGAVYKYDLSLPVEKMYNLVEEMRTRLGNSAKVIGYGHLGDGNLHLNISTPQYDDMILAQIEPFVYEWTSKHRGSISAEHGLGLMKANEIFYSKSHRSLISARVFLMQSKAEIGSALRWPTSWSGFTLEQVDITELQIILLHLNESKLHVMAMSYVVGGPKMY
ncbi:D-2-hydroxyglutarate dehydrogenase, mitochondrial [Morella rubra]|uniref:D-2-hydroxyglutarate dehydrogenase, mitochondrial n=1 Tax=Morella rubra TaxID=262757 RepID=A0A6A1UNU6_9ROSI|nr:D-2-hydroxyglutarate dehydrogenase, mitochondrial [Morella rubra]